MMYHNKTPVIHTGVLFFAALERGIFFLSMVYCDYAATIYRSTIY
jgi:hypothetical protein